MKKVIFICLFILGAAVISLHSCKDDDSNGCGASNISVTGGTSSHNPGYNCMNCHVDGGGGTGCFRIAGTVYDSTKTNIYPNTLVKLYNQPSGGGQLWATLHGDAMGNFYTTDVLDFGAGMYPVVFGTSGEVAYMAGAITGGSCNGCHGITVSRISLAN